MAKDTQIADGVCEAGHHQRPPRWDPLTLGSVSLIWYHVAYGSTVVTVSDSPNGVPCVW